MYYRVCPHCGCNLDPCERCDCLDKEKETAPLPRERPLAKVSTQSLSAVPAGVKVSEGRCWDG